MVCITEIWNEILEFGYDKGDDIPYCVLEEICDNFNVSLSYEMIDKLCELYDVYIG